MKYALALFAIPLFAASVPAGRPEDSGMSAERLVRIHESIQRHIDAGDISGAVTLVARKGRIVHFETHGLMDLESQKPIAKDTIFRIASMSKPVTGVAVMMLVEEGKIRLNDPITRFIPEFKDQKVAIAPAKQGSPYYTVPADRPITVRDLLTHTSGLGSAGVTAPDFARLLAERRKDETLAEFVKKIGATPLDFQPGALWRYSGLAAFDTLGRVVEIASGMPYDQFLQRRIFGPLGMKDTGFAVPQDKRPRLITLYRRDANGKLEKHPNQEMLINSAYFSGGGGLTSTAEDYLQFAQMLVNGGTLNGVRLLSPKTVELMATNHVGDMFNGQLGRPAKGMGFGLSMAVVEDPAMSGYRVSKGTFGWDGAFGTQVWIDPKEKLVSVLMIQTQVSQVQRDFENAVMQAVIE